MKSPAEKFVDEMLADLWRRFYQHRQREFHQDRRTLIQAITWPARYLNDRGVKAPASMYRRILGSVIQAIRQKGYIAQVRRFSVYFLYSIQEHMKHHGDEYYEAAKEPRRIEPVMHTVMNRLRTNNGYPMLDQTTEALAALNRITRARGGRRRRAAIRQPELPTFPPISTGKRREAA